MASPRALRRQKPRLPHPSYLHSTHGYQSNVSCNVMFYNGKIYLYIDVPVILNLALLFFFFPDSSYSCQPPFWASAPDRSYDPCLHNLDILPSHHVMLHHESVNI
jgi:hypothetical protein